MILSELTIRCVYTIGINVRPACRVGASGLHVGIKTDGIFCVNSRAPYCQAIDTLST
jgi:hypothetical protein